MVSIFCDWDSKAYVVYTSIYVCTANVSSQCRFIPVVYPPHQLAFMSPRCIPALSAKLSTSPSRKKEPHVSKSPPNCKNPLDIESVASCHCDEFRVLVRVDHLLDRCATAIAADDTRHSEETPAQAVFAHHVGIRELVALERRRRGDVEALVPRSSNGEKHVGCFAEPFHVGGREPLFLDFFL